MDPTHAGTPCTVNPKEKRLGLDTEGGGGVVERGIKSELRPQGSTNPPQLGLVPATRSTRDKVRIKNGGSNSYTDSTLSECWDWINLL